ncbi:hypothetical protein GMRT_11673 [Giardia muris]|uniref:Uncharacterized protein n=1 Tax=Giardia muris TaxID=5742 RepID=A0A4Z1T650_GIAMU|nr:hypothetical protein GMRT_11673 [Giardia muris]|eukprot:TNJ29533.1 hypothetical protein GMRT_11673 [Giardia muris]
MDPPLPETAFLRTSRASLDELQRSSTSDLQAQARAYIVTTPPVTLPPPPSTPAPVGDRLTHLTQRFQSLDSNRMHWFVRLQALIYISDHIAKEDVRGDIPTLAPGAIQPLMRQLYERRKTFTPFLSAIFIELAKAAPLHVSPVAAELLIYCLLDRSDQAMDCSYTVCQDVPLSEEAWVAILTFCQDGQFSPTFRGKYENLYGEDVGALLDSSTKSQLLELACENALHTGLQRLAAQAVVAVACDGDALVRRGLDRYVPILCGLFSATSGSRTYEPLDKSSKSVKFELQSVAPSLGPGPGSATVSELVFSRPLKSPDGLSTITSDMAALAATLNTNMSALPHSQYDENKISNSPVEYSGRSQDSARGAFLTPTQRFSSFSARTEQKPDALEQFLREASMGPTFFAESQPTMDGDTTFNLLEHAKHLVGSQTGVDTQISALQRPDANDTINVDDLLQYAAKLTRTNDKDAPQSMVGRPGVSQLSSAMDDISAARMDPRKLQYVRELEEKLEASATMVQTLQTRIEEYGAALSALQLDQPSGAQLSQLYIENLSLKAELADTRESFIGLSTKYQALKERDRINTGRLEKYESRQQQFKRMFEQATARYESIKASASEKIAEQRAEIDRLTGELTALQTTTPTGPVDEREVVALRTEVEALRNDKANLTAVTKKLIAKLNAMNKPTGE